MKFRFIEYYGKLYIVLGIGHDTRYDPPDVFYCLPLQDSAIRSILSIDELIIPVSEAIEITDKKRLRAIWTLYGR